MEKLSPNCAQLFVRYKYTVFTMGGTVSLRSVNNFFFWRATVLQLNSGVKSKRILRLHALYMDMNCSDSAE